MGKILCLLESKQQSKNAPLGFTKSLGKFNLSYSPCPGVLPSQWVTNVGFGRAEKRLSLGKTGMIYFAKMVIDKQKHNMGEANEHCPPGANLVARLPTVKTIQAVHFHEFSAFLGLKTGKPLALGFLHRALKPSTPAADCAAEAKHCSGHICMHFPLTN